TEQAVMHDDAVDDERMRREFLDVIDRLNALACDSSDRFDSVRFRLVPALLFAEKARQAILLAAAERKADVAEVGIGIALSQLQRVERISFRNIRSYRPVNAEVQQQQLNVFEPGAAG